MARYRDAEWKLPDPDAGELLTWEQAGIAVLMDIRTELRHIRGVLECANTTSIPESLRRLVVQTKRRRRPKLRVVKRRRVA